MEPVLLTTIQEHLLTLRAEAEASQYDLSGKLWVLDSFSIGGGEGTVYKAVGANVPETIIAKFVRGSTVSVLTNPVGVRVNELPITPEKILRALKVQGGGAAHARAR